MTSRLETYRVSAYNTSKLSENKIHDDTVARRFGFSGGLVPGVDVMAYMMHLPVEKWGRAFLERGLIEARFVKPVYDGEIAERHRRRARRRALDRGRKAAASFAPPAPHRCRRLRRRFRSRISAQPRRSPSASRSMRRSYEVGKWLGAVPRDLGRRGGNGISRATFARPMPIYAREGLGHPGLLQRIMNKVLVDNAILGPWIHVGSRMQLLSAAGERRRTDGARKGDRQLREEGPPLRRTRRAGRRQRQDAAGALPAHRDLPAARAGGGVGARLPRPACRQNSSHRAKAGVPA